MSSFNLGLCRDLGSISIPVVIVDRKMFLKSALRKRIDETKMKKCLKISGIFFFSRISFALGFDGMNSVSSATSPSVFELLSRLYDWFNKAASNCESNIVSLINVIFQEQKRAKQQK